MGALTYVCLQIAVVAEVSIRAGVVVIIIVIGVHSARFVWRLDDEALTVGYVEACSLAQRERLVEVRRSDAHGVDVGQIVGAIPRNASVCARDGALVWGTL